MSSVFSTKTGINYQGCGLGSFKVSASVSEAATSRLVSITRLWNRLYTGNKFWNRAGYPVLATNDITNHTAVSGRGRGT